MLALLALAPVASYGTDDSVEPNDGTIEIEYPADLLEPYRERRTDWSILFIVGMENFMPTKFLSGADNAAYESLFGNTTIPIAQVSLGAKYNFVLGALSVSASGGAGSVSSSRSGVLRQLSITKRGFAVEWTLDAIMHEPYVAPYVSGQYLDFTYDDTGATAGKDSGVTAPTTGYTVGLLIQLNFIDQTNAAIVANRDHGLDNTFLDLFLTQYNTSSAKDDPQFQTSMNWGAGLRLEF